MARGTFSSGNYFSRASAVVSGPPFTIQAWWYMTGWAADFQLVCQIGRSSSTDHRHNIAVGDAAEPLVTCYSRSTGSDRSAITISASDHNKWNHHLGVWRASNNRQVYFNGVAGTADTTSINPTSLNATSIGIQTNGSNEPASAMRIAEVAIWDIDLGADDIAALAKGFSPLLVRPDRLVEYMPLVRSDWSKSGAFSATGTPGVQDHPRIIYPG
jgi:hypothetical protein